MAWHSSEQCVDLELSAGWQLISMPLIPVDADVASLFPGNLGAYGYDDVSRQYVPVTELQPCEGYWLLMAADVTISMCGTYLTDCSSSLTEGWHLAGGPNCLATPQTDPDGYLTAAWGYNTGTEAYEMATEFSPGAGYWVMLSDACDLTLDCVSPVVEPTRHQPSGQAASTESQQITLSAFGADLEGATRADVVIGVDSVAHTYPAAPAPPAYSVMMALYQPDWSGPFYEDVREDGPENNQWIIGINPHGNINPPEARSASIRWDPSEFGSGKYYLREGYDGTGSIVVEDMTAVDRFDVTGTDAVCYFTLVRTPEGPTGVDDDAATIPYVYHLDQCYPNPFNPNTQIGFGLPTAGHVMLQIYNIAGQTVVSGQK